jgi:excinuclease UvrABC nuclease subunit
MNLSSYPTFDLLKIKRTDIPATKGVYIYLSKVGQKIKYIGSAVGQNGLRGRVWSQHLNSKYLEARQEKFSSIDQNQLEKQVKHNGKLVIEKSAFRKNIARFYNLSPGIECLQFIKENYSIILLPFEERGKSEILELEENLIREFRPQFNIKNNS